MKSESTDSEGAIINSPHKHEIPSPESVYQALLREEQGSTGQEQQQQSHDVGCVAHQHQNKYKIQGGESTDPRHPQYGQRGHSDHRHGSGRDSRQLDEHADLQRHQYRHYSHQPLYSPYSPALRAEPQVGASGNRGGKGSYQYREQSGSGSGRGTGSGNGECKPAPVPAGVTYPVPPVRPPRSSARRYGDVGVKTKGERGE
ncbi:hypothetical protein PISMIDRAFT_679493 [Pisolithus microcarpus 441]|uniref:Unplaced genomic scaffold scaffold_44, whole genome shotgun sequence n=1 Tax=Pisolithus microcarpus 441 TaxID=765257 RepID=A0A0C9ZLH0_9AGAM|nr:hypothetical protein BKA83DRAFT_679493 [Pisolithus microcarpus]KIK23222.1 hypothetical protein PISMIDRAFT_679493 [Pisolithus microcarpus 441]